MGDAVNGVAARGERGRLWLVVAAAVALRAALLAYGEWQDARVAGALGPSAGLRYTDVDHDVFVDAARSALAGGSPYDRATYRYTPLVALAAAPALWWRPAAKVLFAALDVAAGALSVAAPAHAGALRAAAAWWLLNPVVANISTRGSADSLVCALCCAAMLCARRRRPLGAGLLLGAAAHVKIFPAAFGLPVLLHFVFGPAQRGARRGTARERCADGARFVAGCAAAFVGLGALFYALYGQRFLWEAYLYHATRVDHRHNMSPHFYSSYLALSSSAAQPAGPGLLARAAGFAPMAVAMLSLALAFGARDVDFAVFAMAASFVALNKVMTAQYFCWFMALAPRGLARVRLGWGWLPAAGAWAAAQAWWLSQAYALEFGPATGSDMFIGVWAASIGFLVVNTAIIVLTIARWSPAAGKIKDQ
eukprot:m51a1_g487 hypothetical protein (421) ;mRNA; f:227686-228948